MTWYIYKWTRPARSNQRGTFDYLGTVEADNQPAAWKLAAERWPDLAKAQWPHYQNGRLICRRERYAAV